MVTILSNPRRKFDIWELARVLHALLKKPFYIYYSIFFLLISSLKVLKNGYGEGFQAFAILFMISVGTGVGDRHGVN